MRKLLILLPLVIAAIVAGTAIASATATRAPVKLSEFKVTSARTSAPAGKVTFVVTNVGKITHEMIVSRIAGLPGRRVEKPNNRVSEIGALGEIGALRPGTTKSITLTLKAGKYELFCNLAGHYKAGQWTGFKVKAAS